MKRKIVLPIFITLFIATITLAVLNWNVSVIVNVEPTSCFDSDNGANYAIKGNASALVIVPNYFPQNTNTSLPVSAEDHCEGDVLIEVVCGSNFGYNGLGGLLSLNCSDLNTANETYSCQLGACVSSSSLPQINSTNLTLYDDFSSGSLNLNKWSESTNFQVNLFTDEHFVNATEGAYHIKQNIQQDTETNLVPNRQFVAGDLFSYDLIYLGGSGNHFSQPLINGNYPPTQIEPCLASGGCGPVGYWNGVPDLDAQIGVYHVTYEFSQSQVKMTTIRPDNLTIINTFTGNSAPFTLTINTHTGHNGLMHFDIDNVFTNY